MLVEAVAVAVELSLAVATALEQLIFIYNNINFL